MKSVIFNNQLLDEGEGHLNGLRQIVVSPDGQWLATGDMLGQLRVYRDMDEFDSVEIRPRKYKANADRFLTSMEFSSKGDVLLACTGIDVLALETTSATVLWRKMRKSTFGFLKCDPLTLACVKDNCVVIAYSDGMMVKLNSNGDDLLFKSDNDGPKSMVYSHATDSLIGTDGYHLWRWNPNNLERIEEVGDLGRYYSVSCSKDEPYFSVRIPNKIQIKEVFGGKVVREFDCNPGLPETAMDPTGRYVSWIESGAGVIGTVASGELNRLFEIDLLACSVHWNYRDYGFVFGLKNGEMRNFPVD